MPISDLYEGLFDGPHATPKPSEQGPVFLGIKNVTEDGHLDFSDVRHIAEADFAAWIRRVEPRRGDIVFTYEATLNRYAIIPDGFRGCLGRRMALIRPNASVVDTRYLHFYFFTPEWRAVVRENTLAGATVDRLPLTRFPEFPVRVPPLPEQRRIASILSAYDDLIENCERRIRVLDEMARALYREWFVNFRYPGHEKVPMVESTQGPIPKGWAVRRLGEIMELNYGKALKAENRSGGAIPVFASSGLVGWHDESLTSGPGIVLGRKGNVGSIYWSELDFFVIDTAYYVTSQLPLRFVYFDLHGKNFINGDAAVPGLSRAQAYSLETIVPPRPLIQRFCDLAEGFLAPASTLRRQAANLRKTRDLLLPRLLSGQLSVSDAA